MTHWTKLKHDVEAAGGVWTDRVAAEAFLSGIAPAVTFDITKPYGTIHGDDPRMPDVAYIQGGAYFNKQGKKVG